MKKITTMTVTSVISFQLQYRQAKAASLELQIGGDAIIRPHTISTTCKRQTDANGDTLPNEDAFV